MKTVAFASILSLFLLCLVMPQLTTAQTGGTSASGTYQFSLEDGSVKYLEFSAKAQADGSAVGTMTFNDEAKIANTDVDGTGDPIFKDPPAGFYIKAEFDCLAVNKNQAVIAGIVRDSNLPGYINQRVLLTVEDNGDNSREPDKLVWGLYKPVEKGWTATDAELKEDTGVGLRWMATDAERKDDAGVAYPKADEVIRCQSFPLSSYSFVDVSRGAGDIQVQQ